MQNSDFDVVIVGAGISGVGMACHLKRHCPGQRFTILERRQRAGGTWDLFRYPGIRSDSDMLTLGFSFRPWKGLKVLADGDAIRNYVEETAQENELHDDIQFGLKITESRWSSKQARWTVNAVEEETGKQRSFSCKFLVMGTGYYNYDQGYLPEFSGIENFKGQVIHPQKWPEDLDYVGKRVVVIGSGATAVTLVPAMAEKGAKITMLQRSPSYILSLPALDGVLKILDRFMPEKFALGLTREKNIQRQNFLYKFFQRFPNFSKKLLLKETKRQLRGKVDMKHFTPKYNPWDQRLCLVPDGDLFRCLRNGKAEVVTDHIDTFTAEGIKLKSGQILEADIIITATGLDLQALGGMQLVVDDEAIKFEEKMFYKATMIEDVPNFSWIFGYTNASWTLKANIAARYLCRLINHMKDQGKDIAVPRDLHGCKVPELPFMGALTSGYVVRANDRLPRQGSKEPWKVLNDFKRDQKVLLKEPIDDGVLMLSSAREKAASKARPMRRAA